VAAGTKRTPSSYPKSGLSQFQQGDPNNIMPTTIRLAAALLLALLFCSPMGSAANKHKRTKLNFGRIEIKTTPGGFPLLVDGVQRVTYETARPIEVSPGRHLVEVVFSPTKRFTKEFDVLAGRRYCMCLKYSKSVIATPCPFPVSVTDPATVNDGDLLTFATDVAYGGSSALN